MAIKIKQRPYGKGTAVDWRCGNVNPRLCSTVSSPPPDSPASFQGSVGLMVGYGYPSSTCRAPDSSLFFPCPICHHGRIPGLSSLLDASFLSIPVFAIYFKLGFMCIGIALKSLPSSDGLSLLDGTFTQATLNSLLARPRLLCFPFHLAIVRSEQESC
ncbi:hypothetical protein HJG60_010120 [Phyllostomus discolor]|uniref:Uncharacterized protein n=1 Tax=Phyllostomus discolor TaxID=89673 RepID=A0A834AW82_9CHIR|nr:hypothetical protein HJG60_010120 [Phyllostomus discolor]